MKFGRVSAGLVLVLASTGSTAWAQAVISAKSGVINYHEGDVLAGGKPIEVRSGKFAELQKGQDLVTTEGRAEILLTPGVFLRVSENTKIVMEDNRLSDTRIRLVSGAVILECAELLQDNAVTLSYGDYNMAVRKAGLFRLDSTTGTVKVFEGEMQIAGAGQSLLLKKGKMSQLGNLLVAEKFDTKVNDSFYRWAARRAEPLSMASFSSARSLYNTGSSWSYGGWMFNPYYGMFTYIPVSGFYNSPFGYRFYSPIVVDRVYNNIAASNSYNRGGNNGYNTWNNNTFYDSSRGYTVATRGDVGGFAGSNNNSSAAPAPVAAAPAAGRGDMGGGGSARGSSGAGGRK